ncbi:hypothetical protein [Luteolibacter sp. LG18]|uniref:hypothetical protein n=1 Tax=Luteolibacter sp. LG18 TaxID=2819286 RepID=UPI002B29F582|nr:hypothetical protein llg_07020 [Luteolibacter sp. LG18]BCU79669.1 hypothetical protein llg_43840 [Luteolibacter sp. LG18]
MNVQIRFKASLGTVEALRDGLTTMENVNARLAVEAMQFTQRYLRGLNRHATAEGLGAAPTLHHERTAGRLEAASDEQFAILRIPRSSGLGRAFHDVVILPGSGRQFLTIPADARTYGRRAGEFAPGDLTFTIVGGRYPALMFTDGWTVAFWLARKVEQKQDRSLLPSDQIYRALSRRVILNYISELREAA